VNVCSEPGGDLGLAIPVRELVVDEVTVTVTSGGLSLRCGRCGAHELVLLEQEQFNRTIVQFLQVHPTSCLISETASR
jgi:hypothetical protein